jgi:hypothetical protein
MKARALHLLARIILPALVVLLLALSVLLAQAAPPPAASRQEASGQSPIASNYCLSCHTPGDSRLEDPTAWRGGIAAAGQTPCPAMKTIREELYYTERLLLAIDRYQDELPGYVDSSSVEGRLAAGQQGYQRLLDAPVTSLEAFTSEAQSVRYKLGKVYNSLQALDDAAKRTRALVAGIVVSLILIGSLVWGLYNTRHVRKATPARRRPAAFGLAVFLLLVFAFFALPLLRVPAEEVVTDAEAQALQTTLDTSQRAAATSDRSQARAWMLGQVAAAWEPFDPAKAQAILAEAQAASEQQRKNAMALWGEAAAAQEAATGDLAKLETAGLIANELNATRSRTWDLRLIAQEWQEIDPQQAGQTLESALQAAEEAQGIYRDLDRRGIAAAWAASDPQRAREIAGQIEDPALRDWALREIAGESAAPQASAGDPAAPEAQTLALLQSGLAGDEASWPAAWSASMAITDPFERGRAQLEIARGWTESDPAQALEAARQIETPLLRDRALRFVIQKTGDASLVSQVENPYDRVMALTALGRYAEAEALTGELKETYPLVGLAQALAQVDPPKALALVEGMQREADKAEALRVLAALSRDPALFERALGMALAARVRNDALAPARVSLDLANAFLEIDPALAQQALAQAYEIAQRISIK